eukprot:gnl/MRDRNA2_/MRDRNA2_66540_c0_seq1.p1 gnl/MRDRNA2_/MRDRNA2_66540_c0~~gnl/MRDRNA2_/MRDRNA2_66540_c0_seq1.p1  ORF type:complete len:763 (-),score=233.36 gnl/MRDRNA2_/MRDRNA2_66540_c0_seq1:149-2437(-)
MSSGEEETTRIVAVITLFACAVPGLVKFRNANADAWKYAQGISANQSLVGCDGCVPPTAVRRLLQHDRFQRRVPTVPPSSRGYARPPSRIPIPPPSQGTTKWRSQEVQDELEPSEIPVTSKPIPTQTMLKFHSHHNRPVKSQFAQSDIPRSHWVTPKPSMTINEQMSEIPWKRKRDAGEETGVARQSTEQEEASTSLATAGGATGTAVVVKDIEQEIAHAESKNFVVAAAKKAKDKAEAARRCAELEAAARSAAAEAAVVSAALTTKAKEEAEAAKERKELEAAAAAAATKAAAALSAATEKVKEQAEAAKQRTILEEMAAVAAAEAEAATTAAGIKAKQEAEATRQRIDLEVTATAAAKKVAEATTAAAKKAKEEADAAKQQKELKQAAASAAAKAASATTGATKKAEEEAEATRQRVELEAAAAAADAEAEAAALAAAKKAEQDAALAEAYALAVKVKEATEAARVAEEKADAAKRDAALAEAAAVVAAASSAEKKKSYSYYQNLARTSPGVASISPSVSVPFSPVSPQGPASPVSVSSFSKRSPVSEDCRVFTPTPRPPSYTVYDSANDWGPMSAIAESGFVTPQSRGANPVRVNPQSRWLASAIPITQAHGTAEAFTKALSPPNQKDHGLRVGGATLPNITCSEHWFPSLALPKNYKPITYASTAAMRLHTFQASRINSRDSGDCGLLSHNNLAAVPAFEVEQKYRSGAGSAAEVEYDHLSQVGLVAFFLASGITFSLVWFLGFASAVGNEPLLVDSL